MDQRLLYNGKVYTMDGRRPQASAVAVRGEVILAVGDEAEVRGLRRSSAYAVDLGGRCVVPGLVDCHLHFEGYSLQLQRIDAETDTEEELLKRVADRARAQDRGTWILGFGWNQNAWGGEFPSREALDRAAPDHPVFLRAKSGHAGWANSIAMRRAGVNRATLADPGGEIVRTADGEPTGIFLEGAQELIGRAVPEPSVEQVAAAMREGQKRALGVGLTGVHDLDGARTLRAWQVLRERGEMRMRVCKSVPAGLLDQALAVGMRSGFGDEWLRIGGVKLFADGALGTRTAWMLEPYDGEPGNLGMSLTDKEQLACMVRQASAAGLASFVHAIGDRANREMLDLFSQVRAEDEERSWSLPRHRIEHVQLLHPDDLGRLARMKVIASMQPIHATSDMEIVDRYWGRRGRGAYAFRSLLERGTALAFGSDAPVETIAPLAGIHAAVTRRRVNGAPGEAGWYPEQRLSVAEAVRAYTLGAAYASGEESRKGSLAPGKLADLTVLERDIFQMPPMEILETQVAGTMVGGKWAFVGEGFDTGQ